MPAADHSLTVLKRNQRCLHPDFEFLASTTVANKFIVSATQSVGLYHGSPA